jgi:hypothetical protein
VRTPPISVENEIEMWKRIEILCTESLKKYQTTLDEDKKILEEKKDNITFNYKNCILLRSGEKEVYLF